MGIYSRHPGDGFGTTPAVRTPRLTVRCEYPESVPTEVSFALSPSYGIHTAREAHDWFLSMMREHEEFEVETDWDAQWPVPFWSAMVRRVVVK
jgi:hypothetical protein